MGCLASDEAGNIVSEVLDLSLFVQQALDWRQQDLIAVPKSGPLPGEMASLEVIPPQNIRKPQRDSLSRLGRMHRLAHPM